MIIEKWTKNRLGRVIFGYLFAILGMFGVLAIGPAGDAYADPPTGTTTTETTTTETTTEMTEQELAMSCEDSLGSLSWLICPTTGKISEAVDWLYEKIENVLVIKPVEMKDGTPIYEIWKYARGITNIVFIILFLVVIYSQLTGVGISNYGIKKVLPKMIVVAILVNLSFIVCSILVDVSNIVGSSLRGVFTSIEESTLATMDPGTISGLTMSGMYTALAGGTLIGVAAIALEPGLIFMLIPVVLGALVSVASGLITIALRQAVVALLIMISPLAVVAYMLPNTEDLFKKWKKLLTQMLVFYPMFSLLFGASSLAGWAIITSAKDGFTLILGIAVQIFPLFFSWSLMKMSGTFLSTINGKIQSLAAKPLATNRAWADSHRQLAKQKKLASNRTYLPSVRLMQFLSDRKVAREEEIAEHAATVKLRGQAYAAMRNYKADGTPSKEGEEAYEMQARSMQYQRTIARHKNNMNKGLGQLEAVKAKASVAQRMKLEELDVANVKAADALKMELARGAKIEYKNARGFHERISNAINAHEDLEALNAGNNKHQFHNVLGDSSNIARYETMKSIMEGSDIDTSFIGADAAHAFNAQAQIVRGKFKDYFDYTTPTQDVVNRLNELTKQKNSNAYIDPIIAGLRTLNMRGDTDLVENQLANILEEKKVELGTYASQSLANFLMFDVKGNDPFLRRFGKYINLETAKMYNEDDPGKRRTRKDISMYEYVNGEYVDYDEQGNMIYDEDGSPKVRKSKRGAAILLRGTSFKDMERTAIADMDQAIRKYSVDIDKDGNETFNYDKFKKNEAEIWDAIMPNIIGDQFSFLSGSEQIVALGKGLTGVNVQKHGFDWEGIFGKDLAEKLTPEQKKDYIDFLHKRTKTFLGGHVPVQIAKTKTDMLESIRNQYALKDAADKDPEFMKKISDPRYGMSSDEYKKFEQERMEDIKKEFVGSFKEDALKGFVKMYRKGYQGEAKDGLIQLLDPDELYKSYFPGGEAEERDRRRRRAEYDDDDDEGMPVADSGEGFVGGTITSTSNMAEEIFNDYNNASKRSDVAGFWKEIRSIIEDSTEIPVDAAVLKDIEDNMLPQYTDVASFYTNVVLWLLGRAE